MRNLLIFSFALLFIFILSCKKETLIETPTENQDAGVTVNTNPWLMTLDNSSLNNTNGPGMDYESDGTIRVLKESLPANFLSTIDSGYVLSIDLDTTGVIRKIDQVQLVGDEAVFETSQANMEDIFLNAEFKLSTEEMNNLPNKKAMTNEEISKALTDSKGYIHPMRITYHTANGLVKKNAFDNHSALSSNEYMVSLTDTFVNMDNFKVWLDAYAKAYSSFVFDFNYKFGYIEWVNWWTVVYHPGRLEYFGAYYNGGVEASATITAQATYEKEYEKVKKLKDDLFKISYKFMVGVVPVFIDVNCDIYGKISCNLSGEATATSGFTANANVKLGVEYKNGVVGPIKEFSATKTFDPLTITGTVDVGARAELYPQFGISIYGAGGPTIDIVPYLSAEAHASASYSLGENALDAGWDASVDFGVDARIGAKLEILGTTLAEYNSGNIMILSPVNIWSTPASIEIVQGNNQQGFAGNLLTNPIEIIVRDSWSNAFPAIPVVFSIEDGEGSMDNDLLLTNLYGKASNGWTLGNSGTNKCKALIKKADGTPIDSVFFTATGIPTVK